MWWISLGLLVVSNLQCISITFASNVTSEIQSEYGIPSHNDCVERCLDEILSSYEKSDYHNCMRECLGSWLLVDGGPCQDISSLIQPNGPHTCSVSLSDAHERSRLDPRTNETVGYLTVTWKPCDIGVQDLTGFVISSQLIAVGSTPYCHFLQLTRQLTREDLQTIFTIPFLPHVKNSALYAVTLRSLPMNRDDPAIFDLATSSCSSLNEDPCFCGLEEYGAPNVTVNGYSVEVTIQVAKKCFNVLSYDFNIAEANSNEALWHKGVPAPAGDEMVVRFVFEKIYDSDTPYQAWVNMLLEDSTVPSNATTFFVKAWTPPPPVVKVAAHSVSVSVKTAPGNFSISAYVLRIQRYVKDSNKFESLSVETLNASEGKNGYVSKSFHGLDPGVYAFQVRERREDVDGLPWSDRQDFIVPSVLSPGMIAGIIIPIIVLLVVSAIVFLLLLWKNDKCQKIRFILPSKLISWLDGQVRDVVLSEKSVLIVWQADFRSRKLGELHSANIRHLASYLNNVCGLNVIVDLFNETEVSQSRSTWIQNACDRADFIMFICPHFKYRVCENITSQSFTGNFHYVFSYVEKELVIGDKFITVLLPYSDVSSSPSITVLQKMSGRVFSLMNDINDLYFHIQGLPKLDVSGKRTVEYISSDNYVLTGEGEALQKGIASFQKALASWKPSELIASSMQDSDDISDKRSESSLTSAGSESSLLPSGDTMVNDLAILPPCTDEDFLVKKPVYPSMIPGIDKVECPPTPSSSMFLQRPNTVIPPPVFVSNPNLEIDNINDNNHTFQKEPLSPYPCYLPSDQIGHQFSDSEYHCTYDIPYVEFERTFHHSACGPYHSAYGPNSSQSFHDFRKLESVEETSPKSPISELSVQAYQNPHAHHRSLSTDDVRQIPAAFDSGFDSTSA